MKNTDFEILPWDSDFFKYKVGKINNEVSLQSEIFLELHNENIKLAYYSSASKLPALSNEFYSVELVDKKTTFVKEFEKSPHMGKVEHYLEKYPNDQLIELAIESGVYSRFNVDPKIGREKFEELYTQWIIKSVSKEIADDVLIYKAGNQIAGFVTVGKKKESADIGIIAVDKNYRGKGIGRALMMSAESLYKNKFESIQVITQGDNLPACKLYESCGYKINRVEYFYHLWKID